MIKIVCFYTIVYEYFIARLFREGELLRSGIQVRMWSQSGDLRASTGSEQWDQAHQQAPHPHPQHGQFHIHPHPHQLHPRDPQEPTVKKKSQSLQSLPG